MNIIPLPVVPTVLSTRAGLLCLSQPHLPLHPAQSAAAGPSNPPTPRAPLPLWRTERNSIPFSWAAFSKRESHRRTGEPQLHSPLLARVNKNSWQGRKEGLLWGAQVVNGFHCAWTIAFSDLWLYSERPHLSICVVRWFLFHFHLILLVSFFCCTPSARHTQR